jgi:hypothetical protein
MHNLNLALREVSTAAYDEQQTHLLLTMAFGRWISTTTKIDKKNLVTSLFSLHSNRFIQPESVDLLSLPSPNRNHHGQHDHGEAILTKFEKMLQVNNLPEKNYKD